MMLYKILLNFIQPLLPIRRPLIGAALGAAVAARDAADGVKRNG